MLCCDLRQKTTCTSLLLHNSLKMLAARCVCELLLTFPASIRPARRRRSRRRKKKKKKAHYLTITTHLLNQWLQPIPSSILKTHGHTHTHTLRDTRFSNGTINVTMVTSSPGTISWSLSALLLACHLKTGSVDAFSHVDALKSGVRRLLFLLLLLLILMFFFVLF